MKNLLFVLTLICLVVTFAVAEEPTTDAEKAKAEEEAKDEVKDKTTNDGPLFVDGFFGTAIDSFAAQELKDYLNPEDSSDTTAFERTYFGISFELQLPGDFYFAGETLHGVRSTDVDCEENPDVCEELNLEPTQGKTLAILKSASSLEAYMELRWHFPLKTNELEGYVTGRLGFVTVSESGGDVMDNHKVAMGVLLDEEDNRLSGSYLEVGYGRSQFFETNPNKRVKIEGLVNIAINDTTSFFAQMVVDSDFGDGADSIQSYYGVSVDILHLIDKITGGDDEDGEGDNQ